MTATQGIGRWVQLGLGVLCMVTIANLQYGWTLFVMPVDQKYHWGRPAIQMAFTIFVLAETWLVPLEGYLIDRIGPKLMVAAGGVLIGCAWLINSRADSLFLLYAGAAAGGIGAGIIVVPISNMIHSSGYESTFLYFGIAQGLIIMLIAPFLRFPRTREAPVVGLTAPAARPDYQPLRAPREPAFWLLYLIFTLVLSGGLMSTAQLAPIAQDFNIAGVPVSLIGLTLPALTFALTLDRTLNGITRPFFGWVSDRIA